MKHALVRLAILAGLAMAGFSACQDAIFATIETEKKAATNTLSETLNVADMETTTPGAVYTVAAGRIFQGTLSQPFEGTISWNPNSDSSKTPYNPGNLICNAMGMFGGLLYGGFIDSSGRGYLYQSDSSFSFNPGTRVIAYASPGQVTMVRAAGSYLFTGAETAASTFELDFSSTPGTAGSWAAAGGSAATPPKGLAQPVRGVGFDGANYWAVAGDRTISYVFQGATPATMTEVYPSGTLASALAGIGSDQINGLWSDPVNAGRVFILTRTKGVFFTPDHGTTWINPSDDAPSGGTGAAPFLSVGGPVDGTNGNTYLFGSDGYGYYYWNITADRQTFTRFDDTTITLYTASVANILVDNSLGQENVLLGTNAQGVWRGVFSTSSAKVLTGTNEYWIHE